MEYSIARTESFLRSFLIKAEDLPDKDEAFVRRLELISVTEQSVCSEGEILRMADNRYANRVGNVECRRCCHLC